MLALLAPRLAVALHCLLQLFHAQLAEAHLKRAPHPVTTQTFSASRVQVLQPPTLQASARCARAPMGVVSSMRELSHSDRAVGKPPAQFQSAPRLRFGFAQADDLPLSGPPCSLDFDGAPSRGCQDNRGIRRP